MGKKKDMEMDLEKEKKTCRHRQKKKRDSKRLGFTKILKCQALIIHSQLNTDMYTCT